MVLADLAVALIGGRVISTVDFAVYRRPQVSARATNANTKELNYGTSLARNVAIECTAVA